MPSPFPGMDPYLEAPDIWPDFHEALAAEIRGHLNHVLPAPYYARLEMRPEIGIVEEGGAARRIVPDVALARVPGSQSSQAATAMLDSPRTSLSRFVEVKLQSESIKHAFVEIRDPSRGHHLITLMEIASPSNKRPGPDRLAYVKKQREVLESDANLIEIDLLRTGQRLFADPEVESIVTALEPIPDYLVLVNRAWQRLVWQVFGFALVDPLPVIGVPLREGESEVTLDLQYVMNRAYDSGPYRRGAVDYSQPPEPTLSDEKVEWARQVVHARK